MDTSPLWFFGAAALGGYLVGSIPFGFLLTRIFGLGDIREIGSGNIGATNVLRTGRKGLALTTLLLDGLKGAAVVIFLRLWIGDPALALTGGIAAVLGHNFPIWLQLKGGKGVATTVGVMIAAAPFVGLMTVATWVVVATTFRISSLSALVALALAPVYAAILDRPVVLAFAALSTLGWVRHGPNIRRLLKGQEPRIGSKNSNPGPKQ
jgi:acyl phosphate:glycerol-3-phosphate acyltransferase